MGKFHKAILLPQLWLFSNQSFLCECALWQNFRKLLIGISNFKLKKRLKFSLTLGPHGREISKHFLHNHGSFSTIFYWSSLWWCSNDLPIGILKLLIYLVLKKRLKYDIVANGKYEKIPIYWECLIVERKGDKFGTRV